MRKLHLVFGITVVLCLLSVLLVACSSSSTTTATTTSTVTTTVTAPTVTVTATPASNTSQLSQLKQLAGPPPSSLDQYFPPKAQAPVYLLEMFNLAGPFEGIGVDLQEGDTANLKPNFQAFQTQYNKVAQMVPEWTSLFPADPVAALGKAVDSGNPAQIGPAMGAVGQLCSDCHLLYQVKTLQKYHWRNFDDIKVDNPVTKQPQQTFGDYMTTMAGGFEGAMVDLQEGQLDKARANYQAFVTEYKALATDGCKQCHTDPTTNKEIPRKYFVDSDSLAILDQLGKALNANPPDAAAAGNLSGAIGNGICLPCHMIHLPAQTAKDTWSKYANILK